MDRRSLVAFVLSSSSLMSGFARAEAVCNDERPFVDIELHGESWTPQQRERVVSDLARSLAPLGIDVCGKMRRLTAPPIATLNIELSGANRANVEILLQDSVTQKRVARELDLSRIPEDGRDLAVAIEADELLRASWAELALDTERGRRTKPRPEVVASVDRVLAPKRTPSPLLIEARAAAEHFADVDLLGGEVAARVPLTFRSSLELAAFVRLSPERSAPHGSIRAISAGGAARVLLRVLGDDAASLHLGSGVSSARIEFRGNASEGARSDSYADWLIVARASVLGRLALSRVLGIGAGVSLGAALRSVEATDSGRVFAAARGLELGATIGVEAR